MLVTLILPQLVFQYFGDGKAFGGKNWQGWRGAFHQYQEKINIIDQLKAATTKEEQENIMLGASDEMREFANSVGISIEKMEKFNEDAHKTIHPIQALKGGIKGLGKAFLSYSIQFAAFWLASKAIEGIVNLIDSQVNALKYATEAAENLNKAYEDMSTTQKQNTKTVEEYGKTWEKLKDGVDKQGKNVSLSDDEYEQYKNAIEQIANVIPNVTSNWDANNEAIKLNVDSVTDLNDKLEETLQKQREIALSKDNISSLKDKVDKIDLTEEVETVEIARDLAAAFKNHDNNSVKALVEEHGYGAKDFLGEHAYFGGNDQIFKLLVDSGVLTKDVPLSDGLKSVYEPNKSLLFYGNYGREQTGVTKLVDSLEDFVVTNGKTIDSITQTMKNFQRTWSDLQFSNADSVMKEKVNGVDFNTAISEDNQTAIQKFLDSQDAIFYVQFEGDANKMFSYLAEKLVEIVDTADDGALKTYQKAAKQWQFGKLSYGDYAKARQSYVNSWDGLANEDRSLYDMLIPYLRDYFGGGMDEYSAMRQRALDWGFTQDQVDSLTSEQLNYIKSLGAASEKVFTSFAAFLADFAKHQTQVENSYDGLKTKWDKATEAQTAAQEVMTATDTNGGVLTQENYNKLIGANKAYGAAVTTIGGVTTIDSDRLNAIMDQDTKALIKKNQIGLNQAMKDYGAALSELALAQGKSDEAEITKRKENVEALKKEILNRKLLGQEMEYSISAYSKWKKAQSGTESGDTFRELKTAVTDLKDGIKSGRTNTNKYKTSGDVLFGEDSGWRGWSSKELNKRLSAAEKLYDKNGELDNREFYNQLLKAGMVVKSGVFQTEDVGKIAKALGYSDTFVAQSLMAAKEYGKNTIDFSNDYLQSFIPKTEVENNTDATKNLTTSMDNLKSSVDKATEALGKTPDSGDTSDSTEPNGGGTKPESEGTDNRAPMPNPPDDEEISIYDLTPELSVDTAPAESDVAEFKDEAEAPISIPTDLDDSAAYAENDRLTKAVEATATKKVELVAATTSVTGAIAGINGGSSSPIGGFAHASGTRDAESGQALVGELGPEIVVSRKTGTWRVAQEPQLTKLDKGDIVFNSEETTRILKNKNAPVGSGQSFASGTRKKHKKHYKSIGKASSASADWRWNVLKDNAGVDPTAYVTPDMNKSRIAPSNSHIDPDAGDGGSGGGGGGGKKTAATNNGLDAILNKLNGLYDWVERALEVAADATQELIDNVADKIGAVAKNQALDKAIAQVGQELDMNRAGYNKYMETAARVQQETGLSQGIVDQIHTGVIEISDYDDDTKKKIEAYKQWYDKAEAVKDTIDGLIDKQNELAKQKLDNIVEYYDHLNDRLDAVADNSAAVRDYMAAVGKEIKAQDYARDLDAMGKKVSKLREEREAYAKELQSLMAAGIVKYDSNEWHEYTSQLEDMDKAILEVNTGIADMRKEIDQIAITNLKYALDALTQTQTVIEALMGFHDAQGTDNTASNYEDLIRNGFEQIQNLEAQNAELRKQQEGLDKLSERYQELQSEINSNEQSIWQAKTAQEQWNDAIADLKIDALQKERDELEKQNTALQKKLDMEQALEDLAKARQRKKLMFSEGELSPLCMATYI